MRNYVVYNWVEEERFVVARFDNLQDAQEFYRENNCDGLEEFDQEHVYLYN